MSDIKSNLELVLQKISDAAQKSGRDPKDVKLIAVTKTIPLKLIEQAIEFGVVEFGENRVQEAVPKIEALKEKYPQVTWHMVGHLQRNKVRQALDCFDIIQSVDSERVAKEISSRKSEIRNGAPVPILVEVNTSGEVSKNGIPPEQCVDFVRELSGFNNLRVTGLMTIGLFTDDQEKVRPCFVRLRELSEEIKKLNLPNVAMQYLSMGMTDDFEVAIQEGSNMVRIGRAIFGKRGE